MSSNVLEVSGLCVDAVGRRSERMPIVSDISFSVSAGEVIALIGESGSGKTTISLACMGYARAGCELSSGQVVLDAQEVLSLPTHQRRELRGRDVAYIAQSAAAAFNGAMTLNRQVTETPVIKGLLNQAQANEKAVALYRELDLPDAEHIGARYPHQVSGGQLQRMMAAMAMICDPKLLILDEPTTALDVTTQIEVLRSIKKLIKGSQTSAIYVSHDLAVVSQIADQVLVLNSGKVVESGSVDDIIHRPQHSYTKELIGAAHVMPESTVQSLSTPSSDNATELVLAVDNVTAGYGKAHQYLALRQVSLTTAAGRTVGVIGESGSGKTTLGRVISGLMPVKSGQVSLRGTVLADTLEQRSKEELRGIQFAFQMADVAINPRHKIKKILGRPLEFYFAMEGAAKLQRVEQLLELVELPREYANRYPRQLSGGERQRVNLARALAAEPQIIICDEITSALDTIVAKSILALLKTLQSRLGVSYLFISHDLSVIAEMADTIAVMQGGEIIECGDAADILSPPYHPYTELLLESVPEMRTDWLDQLPVR